MNLAAIAAGLGGFITIFDAAPYVRDTLRGTTRPHRGAWLIWTSLSLVALASNDADGAVWSRLPLAAQAIGCVAILVLAIRRGEGGVSPPELATLGVAALGVVGWITLSDPTLATAAVIVADLMGGLMMLPKTWRDPDSETAITYVLGTVVGVCTLIAVDGWKASLIAYPLYYVVINLLISAVIIGRRRAGARPESLAPAVDES